MVHEYAANIHLHIIFHSWNTYELFTTQKLQLLPILFNFIKLHLSLYQMYGTNSVATIFRYLTLAYHHIGQLSPDIGSSSHHLEEKCHISVLATK